MMMFNCLTVLLSFCCGVALARPSISPKELSRRQDEPMCGQIIDAVNLGQRFFYAVHAYECLTSVPFHESVALRFIEYYNTTMQFQSTLAHLKNPPEGYQQPSFDFMDGLQRLKENATAGVFKNQYDFEAALQHIVYSVHDAHVDLYAGVLSVFSFASPIPLVAASLDGKETPKVYFADDIIDRRDNITNGVPSTISAVSHINGEPAVEYLTKYAALQSVGMIEPHADWNELMDSPVQDVQGVYSIFSGTSTFYPGNGLNFTFEDPQKDDRNTYWLAVYNIEEFTGPLTTGGDFYNFFVLGLLPASYNEVPLPELFGGPSSSNATVPETPSTDDDQTEANNWNNASYGAFPETPDIVQYDLGLYGGGILSGYFYDDISTGVVSIPHFEQYDWDFGNFSLSLAQFMEGAADRNLSHIIIDLQKNYGGSSAVAFLLFQEFFPGVEPFTGSQRRVHTMANVLGSATTQKYQDLASGNDEDKDNSMSLYADEWVATTRIHAETGRNFTSWEELQGPRRQNGDDFSDLELYDLKNPTFQAAAFDGWLLNRYLDADDENIEPIWKPEDVVLLTDGTCSSACALFVELATTQAGARTVVVGGAPKSGPMQAASGTRGMLMYSNEELDYDMSWISGHNETAKARLPARQDSGMYIDYASFNLRDQLRKDDTAVPLQFRYAAADCRLYFTLDNVYNMSALWHDVARAAFEDPSLCVEGSTDYSTKPGAGVQKSPPKATSLVVQAPEPATDFTVDYDPESDNGLPAGRTPRSANAIVGERCVPGRDSCSGGQCREIPSPCSGGGMISVCWMKACVVGQPCQGSNQKCRARNPQQTVESSEKINALTKVNQADKSQGVGRFTGLCPPQIETPNIPAFCEMKDPRPSDPKPPAESTKKGQAINLKNCSTIGKVKICR